MISYVLKMLVIDHLDNLYNKHEGYEFKHIEFIVYLTRHEGL